MDKNIGPNQNRFKEKNQEFAEEKLPKEEVEEEISTYDDDENEESQEQIDADIKKEEIMAKKKFQSKIFKMMGVLVIVIVIFVLIGLVMKLQSRHNYTYVEVENIMKKAAEQYFKEHKNSLPSKTSKKVELHDSVLVDEKYMKDLDQYLKTKSCSGKVVVQKNENNSYSYIPYLDCGDAYQTIELYKKVIDKKNIVTEGYGLYELNGGYVYRGKEVNNYVKFKDLDILWRIVKINTSGEITLLQERPTENSFIWDDRYNNTLEDNVGINTYKNSYISTILTNIYENKLNDESDSDYLYYEEEPKLFTKEIRQQLLTFNSCVGKRSQTDTSKDGTPECSEVEKTKISLLPVYDFLNASLDPNCNSTISPDCQNYNYLANDKNFWLANGDSSKSSKVYMVSSNYVFSKDASNDYKIRVVIRLRSSAILQKGDGTIKNPYIIK